MSLPRTRLWVCALAAVLPLLSSIAAGAVSGPTQATEDPAITWDLSDIYPSAEAWSSAHARVLTQANGLDKYQVRFGSSADAMLAALLAISDTKKEVQRLSVYARLKGDENVTNGSDQERLQVARALTTIFAEKTAWLTPTIIELGAERVHGFERQSAELTRRFGFALEDALRFAPHTLGKEAESVLAGAGDLLGQPNVIYSQLADGELPVPSVTLSDGNTIKLDAPAYIRYRVAGGRADRKKVFDAFYQVRRDFQGVFGAALATQVMGEEFDAKARRFGSALSDALFSDNMPESVYRTLVAEANRNLPVLHRYLKLRKQALGITDELRYYDLYAPLAVLKSQPRFTVEQSKAIALEVTKFYGPEYGTLLRQGFAGRWMDVNPRPGKAVGAYMHAGAYDVHPYLLFNNGDDFESLSTFVHEWGHAVHSMLSDRAQPFDYAGYSPFIGETASITNEMLLTDDLVQHARSNAEKLYYLGAALELMRVDFFRQAMFAQFQLAIHEEVEQGRGLSGERMTDLYCGLLKKYYGDAEGVLKVDTLYCTEWTYIPHFYSGFYVYQNATSMVGAAALTEALEKKDPAARARFITMLKAGSSEYSYELFRKAGLDMATRQPYDALAARMGRIMDQIDAINAKERRRGEPARIP